MKYRLDLVTNPIKKNNKLCSVLIKYGCKLIEYKQTMYLVEFPEETEFKCIKDFEEFLKEVGYVSIDNYEKILCIGIETDY